MNSSYHIRIIVIKKYYTKLKKKIFYITIFTLFYIKLKNYYSLKIDKVEQFMHGCCSKKKQ